ncbi:MAG: efflux RND transporter periplasmic adaptor subunit [Pirellulaceae bacterium]
MNAAPQNMPQWTRATQPVAVSGSQDRRIRRYRHAARLRMRSFAICWYIVLVWIVFHLCVGRTHANDNFEVKFIEGFSKPYQVSNVAAKVNGVIQQKLAAEGTFVKSGEAIVKIDDSAQREQLKVAKLSTEAVGEMLSAEAELRAKEKDLATLNDLFAKGSATQEEVQRAQNVVERVQANYVTIKEKIAMRHAEHQKLIAELESYLVKAPFSGFLTEYKKSLGEFVGSVEPIVCVIADISKLSVEFMVPREHRNGLALGQELDVFFIESNKKKKGTVYFISPYPVGESNTYTIKIRIPNEKLEFLPGERCQLERRYAIGQVPYAANGRKKSSSTGAKRKYISTDFQSNQGIPSNRLQP